ncbi:hypothetical protein [Burkholderia multivorans]|uniref:hypothetical protein n=2 Tax=Burkholderia multivorans TaxID=87883 RepID=UPI000666F0B2|nr:hypothetical protein [Burkholderia multivorans]
MARKTVTYTVTDANRDQGKTFILTEMPASKAERWALRALSALAASGMEIPDDIASAGLAGIARLGVQAFGGLSWERAEPLINEMFECVTIMPDPKKPNVTRALIEDDIEEIATRLKLRIELFKLHVGFFTDGGLSTSGSAA